MSDGEDNSLQLTDSFTMTSHWHHDRLTKTVYEATMYHMSVCQSGSCPGLYVSLGHVRVCICQSGSYPGLFVSPGLYVCLGHIQVCMSVWVT